MLLKDAAGTLHVNVADYWYDATALAGPWRVNAAPGGDLVAAARTAQANMKSDPMLPSDDKRPAHAPDVIVAAQPAELVVTDERCAMFVEPRDNHYYLLLSGRWFSAIGLNGPWSFVDGKSLPPD